MSSRIDILKSTITRRGGLAKPNRFNVIFDPPALVGAISSGREMTILCESCTLPGRQIMTTEYASVKKSEKIPYNYLNEDVNMSFHLTNDYYIKRIFDSWMELIVNFERFRTYYYSDFVSTIRIQPLDSQNRPIYEVVLFNAYPISSNSIELDNNSENTFTKLQVTMTFEDFTINP